MGRAPKILGRQILAQAGPGGNGVEGEIERRLLVTHERRIERLPPLWPLSVEMIAKPRAAIG
jgi:hypothetical protein